MRSFRKYIHCCEQKFYTENWRDHDVTVAHLYNQNVPLSNIKQEMGVSYGEIYRSLKRHGIGPNRRKKPTYNDVIYFGQSGMNFEEISQLTGYSTRQVRNILQSNHLRD